MCFIRQNRASYETRRQGRLAEWQTRENKGHDRLAIAKSECR